MYRMSKYTVDSFMSALRERNPGQPEFHQAVEEFVSGVIPIVNNSKEYIDAAVLERVTEPDRVVSFFKSETVHRKEISKSGFLLT